MEESWDIQIFLKYDSHQISIEWLTEIKKASSFGEDVLIQGVQEEEEGTEIYKRLGDLEV